MASSEWLHVALVLGAVALCVKPLGLYMARVFMGERVWLHGPAGWLEKAAYRLAGIDPKQEMHWQTYANSVLLLGLLGFLLLFAILTLQHALPLNPQEFSGLRPALAFNAAISFVTNTNWQAYSGETQISHFAQSAGLAVQNFVSAGTGIAVAAAVFRALGRKQACSIGNFWVDLTRAIVYVLLPLSLLLALLLSWQGVVQTYRKNASYIAVETPLSAETGSAESEAFIALGPTASQVAIKQLGSNGGGFFNVNSAHPFENPTPLSNLLQTIALLLLPAACVYMAGVMAGDRRQGWVLLAAMSIIFLPLATMAINQEYAPNRHIDAAVDQSAGNMEGKESRFGVTASAFWAAATTATSNGSVNAMHGSFSPLAGLVPLLLMQFGEVVFGGVGTGAYGMLAFVIIAVFMGGLMVGRTPEYLGKKLGPFEIKMASLVILVPSVLILSGTSLAVLVETARAATANPGAQGFSEILYAFTSAAANNGSAFAGLAAESPFYAIALGVVMFIGRYWIILPMLAVAGSLAAKNAVPASAGTLPTHTPLFTGLLVGVVTLVGVLTFVPALSLGPLAEHFHLLLASQAKP